MKTYFLTKEDAAESRRWYVVNAEDQVVGRLASNIAGVLRGKNKPTFTPHNDSGDFVVVVNAEKIKLTGNKMADKTYYRHTGYVGGIKKVTAGELIDSKPEDVLVKAVKGMLPRNALGRAQLTKLKVYAGPEHPHSPQNPEPLPGLA